MNEEPTQHSIVRVELGSETEPVLIRFTSTWKPGPYSSLELDSYALRATAGWVLVDPHEPALDAAERLQQLIRERPVATILTSDGHERSCYEVRGQWGTPVWGPTPGEAQRDVAYEGTPDHMYTEGDVLPGGVRAIKLAGAWRGDHALVWQAPAGHCPSAGWAPGGRRVCVLFSGDILNGQVETDLVQEDHYRREPGLYFGARPGYADRHMNHAALKASLERLLQEDFDLIAGSHGRTFREHPRDAIAALIETL